MIPEARPTAERSNARELRPGGSVDRGDMERWVVRIWMRGGLRSLNWMYLARIFENRSYPIVPRPTTQHERENEGERVHDRIEVSASGWVQRRLGRHGMHVEG